MKISITFAVFSTCISLIASVPHMSSVSFVFEALNPGFRARTPIVPNTQSLKLNVSINHDGRVDGRWDYIETLTIRPWTNELNEKWYVYENPSVQVNVGDKFYYQTELITDMVLLNGFGEYVIENEE